MAERKRRSTTYIEGNTVRKEERYYYIEEQQEKRSYRARRNQEKASYMTLPYVVVLALASVVILMMAFSYIQARSALSVHQKQISSMEAQLTRLKASNDNLEAKIEASTDLEEVYRIATQEMGMVFPNQDQLILYDRVESEYVRQNEYIPNK